MVKENEGEEKPFDIDLPPLVVPDSEIYSMTVHPDNTIVLLLTALPSQVEDSVETSSMASSTSSLEDVISPRDRRQCSFTSALRWTMSKILGTGFIPIGVAIFQRWLCDHLDIYEDANPWYFAIGVSCIFFGLLWAINSVNCCRQAVHELAPRKRQVRCLRIVAEKEAEREEQRRKEEAKNIEYVLYHHTNLKFVMQRASQRRKEEAERRRANEAVLQDSGVEV